MTELSGHLPDIDLITYYSEHNKTIFARMSPWTKALALPIIIIFITVVKSIVLLTGLYILVLLAYAAAGLPVRKLFDWYLLPLVFIVSLVIFMIWNVPGRTLFSFGLAGWTATLSDNGVLLLVRLLLKGLISVSYSLFFLMTTRYGYFSTIIYRIFPHPIDQIFLMAYRYVFLTLKMVQTMIKALRSRGSGLISGALHRGKLFASIFALIFIRSYDRAERVNKAMESRGFDGRYMATTAVPRMGIADYASVALMLGATAVALWQGW